MICHYISCSNGSPLLNHFVFHFFHAGVLHLLCNASFAYFMDRYGLFSYKRFSGAYVIAFVLSFVLLSNETVGFSGVLMAMAGFSAKWKQVRNTVIFLAVTYFLPHIATSYHLGCYLAASTFGCLYRDLQRNPLMKIKLNVLPVAHRRK